MSIIYTEQEIHLLINEGKPLPANWETQMRPRYKRGHEERHLELTGDAGSKFRLISRQNQHKPLDFSFVLAVRDPKSGQIFRLRRYNGKGHEHTNRIEGNTFDDFHIHTATERYQARGTREDAYAEVTDRYSSYPEALNYLVDDANFKYTSAAQRDIFKRRLV